MTTTTAPMTTTNKWICVNFKYKKNSAKHDTIEKNSLNDCTKATEMRLNDDDWQSDKTLLWY